MKPDNLVGSFLHSRPQQASFDVLVSGAKCRKYRDLTRTGVHSITLLLATNIGGAVSGGFADSTAGWKGYFYFNAGLVASAFLALCFCHPETSYLRFAELARGVRDIGSDASATQYIKSDEEQRLSAKGVIRGEVDSGTIALVGKG